MNILQLIDSDRVSFLWGSLPQEEHLTHVWTFDHRRVWGAFREGLGESLFGRTVFTVPHSGWRQDETGVLYEAEPNTQQLDALHSFLIGPNLHIPEQTIFSSIQEKQAFETGVDCGRILDGFCELDDRSFFKAGKFDPKSQSIEGIDWANQSQGEEWLPGHLILVGWSSSKSLPEDEILD